MRGQLKRVLLLVLLLIHSSVINLQLRLLAQMQGTAVVSKGDITIYLTNSRLPLVNFPDPASAILYPSPHGELILLLADLNDAIKQIIYIFFANQWINEI